MQKNKFIALLAATLLVPYAFAAGDLPGVYAGGGYTGATVDSNDVSGDTDVGILFGRAGYQINQNVAIEARLGTGVDDGHSDGVKVEAQDFYGAYLKAGLPTAFGLYPYVLLGMTHAKLKLSGPGGHTSNSDSDFSYGAGADYWFDENISAGLEYAKFYDKDGVEIDGWTVGLNYKF